VGRETDQKKADQLAHAAVIHHDNTTADGAFAILQHITTDDVQRVAKTYLTPERRTVAYTYVPAEGGAK
jgi:predicted Zn-dependent peptidase